VPASVRGLASAYSLTTLRNLNPPPGDAAFRSFAANLYNDGTVWITDSLSDDTGANSFGVACWKDGQETTLQALRPGNSSFRGGLGYDGSWLDATNTGTQSNYFLVSPTGTRTALDLQALGFRVAVSRRGDILFPTAVTGGFQLKRWFNGSISNVGGVLTTNPFAVNFGRNASNNCGDFAMMLPAADGASQRLMHIKRDNTIQLGTATYPAPTAVEHVFSNFTDAGEVTATPIGLPPAGSFGFDYTRKSFVWNVNTNTTRELSENALKYNTGSSHSGTNGAPNNAGLAFDALGTTDPLSTCRVTDGRRSLDLMTVARANSTENWTSCRIRTISDRGEFLIETYLEYPRTGGRPTGLQLGLFLIKPQ
jgi:hypothetical protein